jgi:hypothetical protein
MTMTCFAKSRVEAALLVLVAANSAAAESNSSPA